MGPAEAELKAEAARIIFQRQHFAFEDVATWKHDLPPVDWLIPGVIPAAGLVQLSGLQRPENRFSHWPCLRQVSLADSSWAIVCRG